MQPDTGKPTCVKLSMERLAKSREAFCRQMAVARQIMQQRQWVLRELAK